MKISFTYRRFFMSLEITDRAQHHGTRKRERESAAAPNYRGRKVAVSAEFLEKQREAFKNNNELMIAGHTIVNVGLLPIISEETQSHKINHIFSRTLKGPGVKATNQRSSGRCWKFAGHNTLRHGVINDFDLKDFRFSGVFLYAADKIERCNKFLHEMDELKNYPLDNFLDEEPLNKRLHDLLDKPIEDGGYWNYFANLVEKYGLLPEEIMPETVNSSHSKEMNTQLRTLLRIAAFRIRNSRNAKKIIKETMEQIYRVVTLHLGLPPKTFDWHYKTATDDSDVKKDLTPLTFKELVLDKKNLNEDFVVLANYPVENWEMFQPYVIPEDNNMVEGKPHTFLNLPIKYLERYAKRAIKKGYPVWFTGDVGRGFHPFKSTLDESLINTERVFGKMLAHMNKGERFIHKESAGCHAMTLIGYNKEGDWQVENSWGADEKEDDLPGKDGFLSMTPKWFKDNVYEIVVPRKIIKNKQIKEALNKEPTHLRSFGSAACHCK